MGSKETVTVCFSGCLGRNKISGLVRFEVAGTQKFPYLTVAIGHAHKRSRLPWLLFVHLSWAFDLKETLWIMELYLLIICLRAQESSVRRTGHSFFPNGVSEYSTHPGYVLLLIKPSRSSSRNCCVKIFCEIRGIFIRRSLNLSGSSLFTSHQRMTGFQRPPIKSSNPSIGHWLAMRLAFIPW